MQLSVKGEDMKDGQDFEKFKSDTLKDISQNNQTDADEDAQIDLSDIPEWTDEMFAKARRGHFYLPSEKMDESKSDD